MQQWQGNLNLNKISKLEKSQMLVLGLQADMKPEEKDDFEIELKSSLFWI